MPPSSATMRGMAGAMMVWFIAARNIPSIKPAKIVRRLAGGEGAASMPPRELRIGCQTSGASGDSHALFQVNILDRIQQLHPLVHGALEGLATGDQAGAAGALVDHR